MELTAKTLKRYLGGQCYLFNSIEGKTTGGETIALSTRGGVLTLKIAVRIVFYGCKQVFPSRCGILIYKAPVYEAFYYDKKEGQYSHLFMEELGVEVILFDLALSSLIHSSPDGEKVLGEIITPIFWAECPKPFKGLLELH